MLELIDRILLNDGVSVISIDDTIEYILENGCLPDHIKTVNCRDSNLYEARYNTSITSQLDESDIIPSIKPFTDDEYEKLLQILSVPRDNKITFEQHSDRVAIEFEFFDENNKIDFLCSIMRLIEKFDNDNVVWGVGRGSSCASYIMYLLRVHDVNSIFYDIPFKEFSKK